MRLKCFGKHVLDLLGCWQFFLLILFFFFFRYFIIRFDFHLLFFDLGVVVLSKLLNTPCGDVLL